jgi:hypothetical protein
MSNEILLSFYLACPEKSFNSKYNFWGSHMKLAIRAAVVALVLTGAVASTQVSSTSTKTSVVAKTSAMPIPMCAPDDPNACGIGRK